MLTKFQRAELESAIDRIIDARVASSWAGSEDPLDREAIRDEERMAARDLRKLLDEITGA